MLKTKFLTVALTSLVAGLAATSSAQAATDYFLKVDTSNTPERFQGESMDKEFPGAIEIKSFNFGAENTVTLGSVSGGAGAGKASFNELTIEKAVDSTTPRFLKMLALGAHFPNVEIIARKSGPTGTTVTPIRTLFQMVVPTKQEQSGGSGEDMTEKLTFAYGAIAQASVSPTSQLKPNVFASWSVITNSTVREALAAPYRP